MASHCTWATAGSSERTRRNKRGARGTYSARLTGRRPRRAAGGPPAWEPGGERQEGLVPAVAVRLRHVAVRERRGQERDVVAAPRKRRGERVVVWRREAGRVEQRDAHYVIFERA